MMFEQIISMGLRSSKVAFSFATKNSNALLAGVGLLSLTGTVTSLVSAIPKVKAVKKKLAEDLEIAQNEDVAKKLKRAARRKVALILAVPVLMITICGGSIIGNAWLNNRKFAALAAAYALSEQKIEDLEAAAKEIAGQKKAALIEEQAGHMDVERRASRHEEDVICTGHGNDLFWEPKSGHWIRANRDFIKLAFSDIDGMVNNVNCGEEVTLNDLYSRLKMPDDTDTGRFFGWRPGDVVGVSLSTTGKHFWDNGTDDYYTEIGYSATFLGKEGQRI